MRPEVEHHRAYPDEAAEIHARGNVYGIDDVPSPNRASR